MRSTNADPLICSIPSRDGPIGTSWSASPCTQRVGSPPRLPPALIVSSCAAVARRVVRLNGPCQTNESAAYSSPTRGSRDSVDTSSGSSGISARSASAVTSHDPSTGPDSTSAVSPSPYRCAYRAAIIPPSECPTTTVGRFGYVACACCTTRCTSSTTGSKSSTSTRSPSLRPCPMWSGPNTAAPARTSRSATWLYRPRCSPYPWMRIAIQLGSPSCQRYTVSCPVLPASRVFSECVIAPPCHATGPELP